MTRAGDLYPIGPGGRAGVNVAVGCRVFARRTVRGGAVCSVCRSIGRRAEEIVTKALTEERYSAGACRIWAGATLVYLIVMVLRWKLS